MAAVVIMRAIFVGVRVRNGVLRRARCTRARQPRAHPIRFAAYLGSATAVSSLRQIITACIVTYNNGITGIVWRYSVAQHLWRVADINRV